MERKINIAVIACGMAGYSHVKKLSESSSLYRENKRAGCKNNL